MLEKRDWDTSYETGDKPWDTGRVDFHLVNTILSRVISAGRALEVGCGTGTNAIWLHEQGFSVIAVDISKLAIAKALEKGEKAGFTGIFMKTDILIDKIPGGPFGFVFDRGCLHLMDSEEQRLSFADKIASYTETGGLWLSIAGSCDDTPRDTGPPMLKAADIAKAVENHFEIIELTATYFDSNKKVLPKAWRCLMKKRHL